MLKPLKYPGHRTKDSAEEAKWLNVNTLLNLFCVTPIMAFAAHRLKGHTAGDKMVKRGFSELQRIV